MIPQRALKILPPEAEISAECVPNFYGGAWVVWARWDRREGEDGPERKERPLTQFVQPALAARWVHEFDRLKCDQGHTEKP